MEPKRLALMGLLLAFVATPVTAQADSFLKGLERGRQAIDRAEAAEARRQQAEASQAQAEASKVQADAIRAQTEIIKNADARAKAEADARAKAEEASKLANAGLLGAISDAVLQGRCEDAKAVALINGRMDLAEQAMRLCRPAPKQAVKANSVSKKVAPNAPVVEPTLLYAEPDGQGGFYCFYESQRRLTVASGKKCPKNY
jgi:F0F1-type ATP synthase membrane subunit b/b'